MLVVLVIFLICALFVGSVIADHFKKGSEFWNCCGGCGCATLGLLITSLFIED